MIEARTDCFDVEVGDLTLGMKNVLSAFVVLSIAFALTVFIFLAECIFRQVQKKNRHEPSHNIDLSAPTTYITEDKDIEGLEVTGPISGTEMASRKPSAKSMLM